MTGLTSGLLVLGGMAIVASLFHIVVRDEFGERTAGNLRKMNMPSAAEKWTKERGQRTSLFAAQVWGGVAAVILVGAFVTMLVGV